MNKELKEAIKVLNSFINAIDTYGTIDYKCINNLYNPIQTVLTALENSIPKQELEKDLKILENTEVDNNANFWMKHGIEEYLKKLLEGK